MHDKATPRPNAPLPAASQHQVTSSKHPELFYRDLTCPIAHDRTHDRVRSSLPQLPAPHQCISPLTGRRPYASGHNYYAESSRELDRARACHLLLKLSGRWNPESGHFELSVQSLFDTEKTPPSIHQLLHPCANVPTTKCITLCMCVSIFSQTFSRVLAFH